MGERLDTARGEVRITPWDALLLEVRRSAYRCLWLDQKLDDQISRERQLEHESTEQDRVAQAVEVRKWVETSRRERLHLARVAKAAIDAGLSERYVRSIEIEAKLIARVIERSLGVLELTEGQKREVALELRAALQDISVELQERHAAVAALPQK